jgi:hypothetical protein
VQGARSVKAFTSIHATFSILMALPLKITFTVDGIYSQVVQSQAMGETVQKMNTNRHARFCNVTKLTLLMKRLNTL